MPRDRRPVDVRKVSPIWATRPTISAFRRDHWTLRPLLVLVPDSESVKISGARRVSRPRGDCASGRSIVPRRGKVYREEALIQHSYLSQGFTVLAGESYVPSKAARDTASTLSDRSNRPSRIKLRRDLYACQSLHDFEGA